MKKSTAAPLEEEEEEEEDWNTHMYIYAPMHQ